MKLADKLFPEFKLMWLVDEVKKNLPQELDFIHEARNADRLADMFKHLKFLKVILSGSQVALMSCFML